METVQLAQRQKRLSVASFHAIKFDLNEVGTSNSQSIKTLMYTRSMPNFSKIKPGYHRVNPGQAMIGAT